MLLFVLMTVTVMTVTVLLYHATTVPVRKLSVLSDRATTELEMIKIQVGLLLAYILKVKDSSLDIRTYAKGLGRYGRPF